jgi:CRISPR-associated RAMP protein (TIGR02581 family)
MIHHIECLKNRAILELRFNALEPISVGMYNEGNIRKIVGYIRDDKFIPFIPSESIKGVLRNIARKIFKNMENGFDCNKGKHNANINSNVDEYLKKIYSEDQLKELDKDIKKDIYLALNECYVCRLFGSNMVTGKLIINDMIINGDVYNYTSTAIYRKKRIVKEDSLFTVEYVVSDNLMLTIIADNIEKNKEGRLLAVILDYMIKLGIEIGGLKSRGYGLIKLDDENSRVKIVDFKEIKDRSKDDDIIYNINALALKEGYFRDMNIKDYINETMGIR